MGRAAVSLALLFVVVAILVTVARNDDGDAPPASPPDPDRIADVVSPPLIVPGAEGAPDGGAREPASDEDIPADDGPASLRVRLLDATTGKPVTDLSGLVLTWAARREGRRGATPDEEGWFPFPATGAPGEVEIGVPGFARVTFDPRGRRGRVELTLTPARPAAIGRVTVRKGRKTGPLEVSLRPLRPDRLLPEFQVLGLPYRAGLFRLYDLPEGHYELEVTSIVDGVCLRAKRSFHHLGGATEIDSIELVPWAGIRARVVDQDGRVVPQARVVIVREEEDEQNGRVIDPDQGGWVTFADFEPGAWHRVAAGGLPGPLDRLVVAPEKRGELVTVELTWPDRLTTCLLHFRREGKVFPEGLLLGFPVALRKEHIPEKGTVRVDLLPGEYTWGWGLASGPPVAGNTTLVVPPRREFETTIEVPLPKPVR